MLLVRHFMFTSLCHIKAMAEAVSKGYDYTRLKNPHLSGTEVDIILSELERKSNRNFKGRL